MRHFGKSVAASRGRRYTCQSTSNATWSYHTMPMKFSFGEVKLGVRTGQQVVSPETDATTQFRLALLGDFSGRASRGVCEPGARIAKLRPMAVDRDNLDQSMAKLDFALHAPISAAA